MAPGAAPGQLFAEPSDALGTVPAAGRFLAWWDQAPDGPTYIARTVVVRPSAREIIRPFPTITTLGAPTLADMETFVRNRLTGWPVFPDTRVRMRRTTVAFSFGDLARMVAKAQDGALTTARSLEECLG